MIVSYFMKIKFHEKLNFKLTPFVSPANIKRNLKYALFIANNGLEEQKDLLMVQIKMDLNNYLDVSSHDELIIYYVKDIIEILKDKNKEFLSENLK